MNKKKLIILNGSPRRYGTSYSFAKEIKQITENFGNSAEILHIIDYFDKKQSLNEFKNIIYKADIICIVSPLYVDTLPYPVIWFLEIISSQFKNELKNKSFFVVAQSGVLDTMMLQPLLNTCNFFAEELDMKWHGGLSCGGGAAINGKLIENLGKRGKKIKLAFELALKDVFEGNIISPKSQELITLKIPKSLYTPLAIFLNYMSNKMAKKNGLRQEDISRKAYS